MRITEKYVYAWHFLRADWKTGERLLDVKIGDTLIHTGGLAPCSSGLHASVRVIDALRYAPSSLITMVECAGSFVECGQPSDPSQWSDKFVCSQRTALWGYDATDELREFARLCALDVIDNWREYDSSYRPTGKIGRDAVPEIVLKWLETGDEQYRQAAHSAAHSAHSAHSAAHSAHSAYSAAYSAYSAHSAYSAAHSAYSAYSAAHSAAYSAAHSAAHSAAYSAYSAHSADSAAHSAAHSAARDKQNAALESLLISGALTRGLLTTEDL